MDWTKAKLERRDFLKLLAGATSGVVLSGYAFDKLAPLDAATSDWPEHFEERTASVCMLCPGGCGIQARVVDGSLVKLEGNPLHPVNRGRLCPLGQSGLHWVYHPDRIKGPMKRVGGKGSSQWISISWDEAIKTLSTQLAEWRQMGNPYSLVVLDGQLPGLMTRLLERFCRIYGTPNYIQTGEPDGMRMAHALMQGRNELFGYGLEKANYILSFGCSLLDGWRSPVQVARAYGHLRQERPGGKAKIVQIDRRLSTTAARSDEWIPVRPGTEGALALGIAYTVIREELYNQEFVVNHTFGFDDWVDADGTRHLGFKQLVLKHYRPEDVSGITGVPVDTLIRVAKEFGSNRPAIALGDANATLYSNGTFNAMAIHALNALVGNLDTEGGVLIGATIPFTEWPPAKPDTVMREASKMPRIDMEPTGRPFLDAPALEAMAENILNEEPYKVNAIFLCESNPVFSTRSLARFQEMLEKVPLVVSFSSFMDESTAQADMILPDATYLEKWQDGPASFLSGVPVLGIAQPVIKPLYNTMHTGDLILKLAQGIGEPLREAFPWEDFQALLKASVRGIHQAQYGQVFSQPFEEAFEQQLQERGWWIQQFSSFDEFWDELVKKGGWSGLTHSDGKWGQIFRTPSKKFEFYSQTLKAWVEKQAERSGKPLDAVLHELKIEAEGDEAFMPHYEPARVVGDASEYPFYLNPFQVLVLNSGRSANLPWVQEIMGNHVNVKWESWLEIHPQTARRLGIADGDWVWVESPHAKVRVRAKYYAGAGPDVVNMPYGLGHTVYGRWAEGRGVNPNTLIGNVSEPLSGLPARFSTRVRVAKA